MGGMCHCSAWPTRNRRRRTSLRNRRLVTRASAGESEPTLNFRARTDCISSRTSLDAKQGSALLGNDPFNYRTSEFDVVELRQSARVTVTCQSFTGWRHARREYPRRDFRRFSREPAVPRPEMARARLSSPPLPDIRDRAIRPPDLASHRKP